MASKNNPPAVTPATESRPEHFVPILLIFLRLGCTGFGGPAAHLGYFRRVFVEERYWLSEAHYASLVALSQFLPGPGSSQVGFALGMQRGGLAGGIAAFIGFTLPSFMLMAGIAAGTYTLGDHTLFAGLIQGLKLLAIVVVADACQGMFRNFCTDRTTRLLAVTTLIVLLAYNSIGVQAGLLLMAAAIGHRLLLRCQSPADTDEEQHPSYFRMSSRWLLALLAGLLILVVTGLFCSDRDQSLTMIFLEFFRVGSLVFGGGHVVLPLMEQMMVGPLMSADRFLAGYGLAQAVPGPMFTLASFLGADIGLNTGQNTWLIALVATVAIFLPGLVLMACFLGHWQQLSRKPHLMGAIAGINAAVVGLLLNAWLSMLSLTLLHQPLTHLTALPSWQPELPQQLLLLLTGWILIRHFRVHIVWLVAGFALTGMLVGI